MVNSSLLVLITLLFGTIKSDDLVSDVNITNQLAESGNADEQGKWTDSSKCQTGRTKQMSIVEVPFIIFYTLSHHALQFKVLCEDGHHTNYTVDFSPQNSLEAISFFKVKAKIDRRFGYYAIIKRVIKTFEIDLPIKDIDEITKTNRLYQLRVYDCRHYAEEMFEKISEQMLPSHSSTLTPKKNDCKNVDVTHIVDKECNHTYVLKEQECLMPFNTDFNNEKLYMNRICCAQIQINECMSKVDHCSKEDFDFMYACSVRGLLESCPDMQDCKNAALGLNAQQISVFVLSMIFSKFIL